MSGGWGCPHEKAGKCRRLSGRECDPGMKGCVLSGRFIFSVDEKNRTACQKRKVRKRESQDE